tara:strand:- start:21 stop:473 length:453 start_codon:yes stop_codon:yes gene_type:complete
MSWKDGKPAYKFTDIKRKQPSETKALRVKPVEVRGWKAILELMDLRTIPVAERILKNLGLFCIEDSRPVLNVEAYKIASMSRHIGGNTLKTKSWNRKPVAESDDFLRIKNKRRKDFVEEEKMFRRKSRSKLKWMGDCVKSQAKRKDRDDI